MPAEPRRSRLDHLLAWWKALPLAAVLTLVLLFGLPIWLMFASGEDRAKELYYPASHFPMYSDFTDWDYVVYLANDQGEPFPMAHRTGGLQVARLKKKYNSLLNEHLDEIRDKLGTAPSKKDTPPELRREVGQEVLGYAVDQWRERRPGTLRQQGRIRLYLQEISRLDGQVRAGEPQLVGEWGEPARVAPAQPATRR